MTELLTKERVLEALRRIEGPGSHADIVAEGLVSEIVINKGKVYFAISVDQPRSREFEALRQAAENAAAMEAETVRKDRSRGPVPRAMPATAQAACRASPTSSPWRQGR